MSDLVKTSKNKGLINFETLKPEDVFKAGGSDPIIEGLQKILDSHAPDTSTDKGRKEIASFSYSFSTSKTFLKAMGDKLTEKHKAIIKPITTERIKLEKACDSMRDQARESLNVWEEEQTRISNEKKARVKYEAEMEESRIEYDKMMIDAYYDNDMFDREKKMKDFEAKQAEEKQATQDEKERIEAERLVKEEADQKEQDDIAYKAKLATEAAKKAKEDAEFKIEFEKKEKERLIIEAENAEKQRLQDIEDASIKAKKEQDEALEKQRKDQEEKERIEREKKKKEQDEKERLARNRNHQKAINRKIVAKLTSIMISSTDKLLTESQAQEIVKELVKNPIPEISINYGGY